MNYTNHFIKIALSELTGVGPRKVKLMLENLSDIHDMFSLPLRELYLQTGVGMSVLNKIDRDKALFRAEQIVLDCDKLGIQPIFHLDLDYPRRLKLCDDGPIMIYSKGTIDYNSSKYVSIVGTRTPTEYGYGLCRSLIEDIQSSGAIVVSGLAYGIDITIHKLCLEYDIPTICVLAHGLERIYPSHHKDVAENMLANGGAWVTEFSPNAVVERVNFPRRNRIVAGMCDATIVVESKKKGGSLITAKLADGYDREVFAFPGHVHVESSWGCNDLIAGGNAHLLRSGSDFLDRMKWSENGFTRSKQTSLFYTMSEEEKSLVKVLNRHQSTHIDAISFELKQPISIVNVLLFQLEMEGLVRSLPGNLYQLL